MKTVIQRDTCSPVFIEALLISQVIEATQDPLTDRKRRCSINIQWTITQA